MLQVAAGFNTPNIGIDIKRGIIVGSVISRVDPQLLMRFPIPIGIDKAARTGINAVVGDLIGYIVNHASGLLDRSHRQSAVGNHFRGNFAVVYSRDFRGRNIRDLGIGYIRIGTLARFHTGIFICFIAHGQFPFVSVLCSLGVFNVKHIRTAVDTPDGKGIGVTGGVIFRLGKQNALAADIFT